MKLNELDNKDLFKYMLVYGHLSIEDKNKINFIVYKNHLMYLKENDIEKYNYYYQFLNDILNGNFVFLKDNRKIKINNIDDFLDLFNSCMKNSDSFFENSLFLNNILINNDLCPMILYAFNNVIFTIPVDEIYIKKIIEFSIMSLYRAINDNYFLSDILVHNSTLLNESGAISNIYLNKDKIIKYPKTIASKLFLMQQEMDSYIFLSDTKLKLFLANNYNFDNIKKIVTHDYVEGENGEFYLFNHIPFTNAQIKSLKEFYTLYKTLCKNIILDIHPGNFIWNEKRQQWIIIDLGVLPSIGKEYYDFDTFEEYFENIWLKREETMRRVPIRSLDFVIDLKVKDRVLKI